MANLVCVRCGETLPVTQPMSFVCPRATIYNRHHSLVLDEQPKLTVRESFNPFIAFRRMLMWASFADALGMSDDQQVDLITVLTGRVKAVDGAGFHFTPLRRADDLSAHLGFSDEGGVWIKDETANVAGSQKARHIFTELLHLMSLEIYGRAPWTFATRPELAIASCGNAAIAASTLAASVNWPINVFVPADASETVLNRLHELNAKVNVSLRTEENPTGDPCVREFRIAVSDGCIPFGVQGPENAWCLDGGRTIGWEIAEQARIKNVAFSRAYVQVGGGAFAANLSQGLATAQPNVKLMAVQTAGCAPLERAWRLAGETGSVRDAGSRWETCMWPWESTPSSIADGILDDETYDWVSVLNQMDATKGRPVVASENIVRTAWDHGREYTGINVSPTGSAGLAGLVADRRNVRDDENVLVVFSGVLR